jgi:hypothetical protein
MRLAFVAVALAACAPHGDAATTFGVSFPDAAAARTKVGVRFYAKPVARCVRDDGSDARWAITGARVVSGALPPGIAIEDGVLTGRPTSSGDFGARLVIFGVSCAGRSYPDQTVDVHLTVRS